MKSKISTVLAGLSFCITLTAQIKIGNNPDRIDPSSVLELESDKRVLVITRVSGSHMNGIVPLEGALIYNTDTKSLYYYNGLAWQNLNDGDNLSITAEPMLYQTPSVLLTDNGGSLNLEVGQITEDHIPEQGLGGSKLRNRSVSGEKLLAGTIGNTELREAAVGENAINFNELTLRDFSNDAGFITGLNIISAEPGNVLSNRNGAYYNDSELQAELTRLALAIAEDKDGDAENEVQLLSLEDTVLSITGGNSIDLSPFISGETDDQNLTGALINGYLLQIEIENGTPATIDLSELAGGLNHHTAAQIAFNPTGNTLSANVQEALVELQTEIDGISAGGTANPTNELQQLQLSNTILSLSPPAAVGGSVDLDSIFVSEAELGAMDFTDADADPTNELQDITSEDGSVSITTSGINFDLSVAAGGTDDQDLSSAILSGTSLTISIEDGAAVVADLSALATVAELAQLNIDDADADPTNELQDITSLDGSVNITPSGNNFDLSVTGTAGGINLATSDLIQTGGDRLYQLDGQNLSFAGSGSIGIGTENPQSKLHVSGEIRSSGYANSNGVVSEPSYAFTNDPDTGMWRGSNVNHLRFSTAGIEAITISPNQDIGLGTDTPAERLHVIGNILASGTVTPDYVFEAFYEGSSPRNPKYRFADLIELETFIKNNRHLPGVPSAKEVELRGGILVNHATMINLEKIEELFLHTINQEKVIRQLLGVLDRINAEVAHLKNKLDNISPKFPVRGQ